MFDGDAVFVMASGDKAVEFNMLTALIAPLTAKAIRSSVKEGAEPIAERVNPLLYSFFKRAWKSRKQ